MDDKESLLGSQSDLCSISSLPPAPVTIPYDSLSELSACAIPSPSLLHCTTVVRHGQMEDERTATVGISSGVVAAASSGTTTKAATLLGLIQMFIDVYIENDVDKRKEELLTEFLLVHQWFTTSEELAQSLIDVYQGYDETVICQDTQCHHLPVNTDCTVQKYKKATCQVIRHWMCSFPLHFDTKSNITSEIEKFRSLLELEGNHKMQELLVISKIPSYDWMHEMSIKSTEVGKHARKVSLVFDHLEPVELAAQLTYLEYKAFRRIQISDFKNYVITASLKDEPKLERSVALFNGLSQWVQCMVLSRTTPQQRADVICKFVDVSKHLQELQNFNTLMAIVGGLSHSALARLSKTVACLPTESQKTLAELTEMLSSSNNFSRYRKVYHQCKGFKIPILGIHLKDLISLDTAVPDKVDDNKINICKISQLAVILKELTRLQSHNTCPVDINMDLVNTLKLSLDLYHTEDEIYELSLAREPRGSSVSPSTLTKQTGFADWLSGLSPPDPNIINKHVHDMVEAVFKNYDTDRDGFISHEEFESIAGNFPFIDSFCILDTDKDGMISKQEMKTYFLRANCHALRNSFKHAFHETTYFKPTFCVHCMGLLWGLVKQGWKCKDCGISAHKHCKDMVVMECRSKDHRRSASGSHDLEAEDSSVSSKWKSVMPEQKKPKHMCQHSTQTETVVMRLTDHPQVVDSNCQDSRHVDSPGKDILLCEHHTQLEEICKKVLQENSFLKSELELANQEITLLKSHLVAVRQNTIEFILEQMDMLQGQQNTLV